MGLLLDAICIGSILGSIAILILCYVKRLRFLRCLFTSAGLLIALFIAVIFYCNAFLGIDIVTESVNQAVQSSKSVIERTMSDYGSDVKMTLSQAMDEVGQLYLDLFPALLIIMCLGAAYAAYMLVKQAILLCRRDASHVPPFSMLRVSRTTVAVMGGCVLLYLFLSDSAVSFALLNLSIVLLAVTAVCGLSLADYFLRYRLPWGLLRLVLYVAIFFVTASMQGFLFVLLIGIGTVDAFANLRIKGGVV